MPFQSWVLGEEGMLLVGLGQAVLGLGAVELEGQAVCQEVPGLEGGPSAAMDPGQPHSDVDCARPLQDLDAVHVGRAEQDALGDGEGVPLEGCGVLSVTFLQSLPLEGLNKS